MGDRPVGALGKWRSWRGSLIGAVALAVTGFAIVVLRPSPSAPKAVSTKTVLLAPSARRKPLPALRGQALDPPPATLALTEGRPAVIDVWASWCLPCRKQAPVLVAMHARFGTRVRFLGVDVQDSRSAARAFDRRFGVKYSSIFDPRLTLANRLGVYGLPSVFLVDRHGRIAARVVGKHPLGGFAQALQRLLAES